MTTCVVSEVGEQTRDLAHIAEGCVAVLGDELTAYLAGADSVAEFESWVGREDDAVRRYVAPRLTAVAEVIRLFTADNRLSLVCPWLREVGAGGDDAPARSIRAKGDDEGTAKMIVQAADGWLMARRPARPALG